MPVAALDRKLQQTIEKCKPNHTQAFGRPEKALASDAGLRNVHEVLVLIRNLASAASSSWSWAPCRRTHASTTCWVQATGRCRPLQATAGRY